MNSHSNNKIRLQKYLSLCGIASRRKSEKIILDGRVKVNDSVINTLGYKVSLEDKIELDNKKIFPEEKIYIVLNKQKNIICTHNDKSNRKTIYDLVDIKKSLFSLGRLDKDSTGLIILTNDGDFANNVIHPAKSILKEYFVESYLKPEDVLIENFKKGIKIDNILYKAENIIKTENENVLKIFLNEGKKREIRIVYDYFSIRIKVLRREAIGGLRLMDLNIKEGGYKIFNYNEIYNLIFNN